MNPMKKIIIALLVSVCVLNGCHSNTTNQQGNSNSTLPVIDTTKMHAVQQTADTNIKDGPLIKRYPNGVIKEKSNYLAGKRQGECQSFYENGKLWSDDYFTDGILDGATSAYYENGQKRYEGTYIKGKPSGTWNFYDDSGKLVRKANYGKKGSPVM
jgi:antitoxin component YwqK of YwqJK toxin-antitoxin module